MSIANDMVDLYVAAEKAVLKGQSYTINNRSLDRADLEEIRKGRKEWEQKLAAEQSKDSGGNSRYSLADFTQ